MTRDDVSTHDDVIPGEALATLERLGIADPPAAIAFGAEILPGIDAAGTIGERLDARRLLAMAHAHASQFDTALRLCLDAQQLPGATSASIELARVGLATMQPLANLDRIEDAIAAGKDALRTFESEGSQELAGRAALNIGAIYAMTGRPADALPWFDRAAALFDNDSPLQGQIQTNRGTALAALDRFQEAEAAFSRASAALATHEMSWAQAIAEGNLADLAARQGEINRSLRHFEISRRHLERDEAWGDLARLNAEEAAALAMTGLTGVARETFTSAIEMLRQYGTTADLATAEVAYGTALVDAGDLDDAGRILTEARSLIDAEDQPALYVQMLSLHARLAIANGEYQDARQILAEAIPQIGDRPVQHLRWSVIQARLADAWGDRDTAMATLRQALDAAATSRITPLIADLATTLSELTRETGNEGAADALARQAIEASEQVRDTIQAGRIRQSWHRERLDIYSDLYLSSLGKPDKAHQAEAFDISERIRSRALLDAMHLRSADFVDMPPATEAEKGIAVERDGHHRWLNWMYSQLAEGLEPSGDRLEELRAREQALAQLDDRLATLRPALPLGSPIPLAGVQEVLADDSMILSFLRTGSRYSVQVISPTDIVGIPGIVDASEIGPLVAQLQFQLNRALAHGDRPISPAREARLRRDTEAVLASLYDRLIAPVAARLDGVRRVMVIPSSDLYSVPFAALLGPDGYLVDHHELTTAPGVTTLARMRSDTAPEAPRNPLIAGVPDDSAPGLGEEARFVAAHVPGATLLLEDTATRDAVLDAMPRAGLVHLACHGRFDSMHPAASGLRLADGWLTVDQLMECRLDRPLVTLSGCETGRVRVDRGDDLVGIIVAMIAAGARGLVTSLWKTHDRAAMANMDAYYDGLTQGMDPITALHRSQRMVREDFPHPAFWAPFVGVHPSRKGEPS